jgi:hypothetical protein
VNFLKQESHSKTINHPMTAYRTTLITLLVIMCLHSQAQIASSSNQAPLFTQDILSVPGNSIAKIQQKLNVLDKAFDRKTKRYLKKLENQELKVYKKLWKKDSMAAKELMGNVKERYYSLPVETSLQAEKLNKFSQVYSGKLDSLRSAFRFLENSTAVPVAVINQIDAADKSINSLQSKLNQTDQIRKYLKERKEQLNAQLEKFGLAKKLKQYNKQFYYYQQQLNEYKAILNDPARIGKKVLGVLSEVPAFRNFFAKYSQLGSLFNLPGSTGNDPLSIAGLQTRASVMQDMQNRFGTGPGVQQALQQNMQSAQDQMSQLKNKLNQHLPRGGGSDEEMPDFKPNNQKTKSFWQRIEYGTNFQSQRPNNYFPVTTDIGLSIGYKLNDKSIIGLGASYKIGWGQNIRNINITHQGAGMRSFADVKLKGSFWISGGYEMNYRSAFSQITALQNLNAWQQSGLIGMSKVVSMQTRFFKKTRIQLLWDFLSYKQAPRTQPLVFRVGYNLK